MVRTERLRLSGEVEVDEAYVGGVEHGGRRGRGTCKCIVVIAVELRHPKGFGRVRMRHVSDVSAASLLPFVCDAVASGTVVITDGWGSYNGLAKHGYEHQKIVVSSSGGPRPYLPARRASCRQPCSNDGSWAHTKGRSPPITSSRTWRNSHFDSIAAPVAAVASSSADSSNRLSSPVPSPSPTSPAAMTGDYNMLGVEELTDYPLTLKHYDTSIATPVATDRRANALSKSGLVRRIG